MSEEPGYRARYWVLFLLFLVSVLNLFDRHVINILAQDIKTDLGISDTQLGLLTGTAFGVFYSVLGIPLGRLADRVNRPRLIAGALALWSGFTVLSGCANSFIQLFVARMGVGVGEAGSHPASTTLVPDYFSERSRGAAMSVLLLGAPIGSFLGMFLGGLAGSLWGWRAAFIVAGLPGLFLAIVILLTMRDPRALSGKRPEPPAFKAALLALWQNKKMRGLAVFITCATFGVYASSAWLPAVLIRLHGIPTGEIGIYTGAAIGVGGGAGVLGGGFVCDFFRDRIRHVEIVVLMTMAVLCLPCLALTLFSGNFPLAVTAMFFFNIFSFGYLSPAVTLIQREAQPEIRSLAIATNVSLANIVSLTFGLPLVGLISDSLTTSAGPHALVYALAISIFTTTLTGLLFLWRSLAAFRPITALTE